MRRFIFGLIFLALGAYTIFYFTDREDKIEEAHNIWLEQTFYENLLNNEISKTVNETNSILVLERAEAKLDSLSKENKDRILPYIILKRSRLLFDEAEKYLQKAIEIEKATFVETPMPPADQPPPPKALHPLTVINFQKAANLYEKARKEIDKLKDKNFDFDLLLNGFYYNLNYLKGEIYYRILEFLADQNSAQELFNQTLTFYKYALRERPSDINTIVNIELLIKNQNNIIGSANPQMIRKKMLNSRKFGVGRSSGN